MLSTSTSTSTYVPSGLSTSTSTSTEIRYSSTTSTSTKYSGPNPALGLSELIWEGIHINEVLIRTAEANQQAPNPWTLKWVISNQEMLLIFHTPVLEKHTQIQKGCHGDCLGRRWGRWSIIAINVFSDDQGSHPGYLSILVYHLKMTFHDSDVSHSPTHLKGKWHERCIPWWFWNNLVKLSAISLSSVNDADVVLHLNIAQRTGVMLTR